METGQVVQAGSVFFNEIIIAYDFKLHSELMQTLELSIEVQIFIEQPSIQTTS